MALALRFAVDGVRAGFAEHPARAAAPNPALRELCRRAEHVAGAARAPAHPAPAIPLHPLDRAHAFAPASHPGRADAGGGVYPGPATRQARLGCHHSQFHRSLRDHFLRCLTGQPPHHSRRVQMHCRSQFPRRSSSRSPLSLRPDDSAQLVLGCHQAASAKSITFSISSSAGSCSSEISPRSSKNNFVVANSAGRPGPSR